VRSAPGATGSARRGDGILGIPGVRAANLGGVGRTGLHVGLTWLEWRRRAATGGRGREDEVEHGREREWGKWKWEREF
jgi:hypothetical protein